MRLRIILATSICITALLAACKSKTDAPEITLASVDMPKIVTQDQTVLISVTLSNSSQQSWQSLTARLDYDIFGTPFGYISQTQTTTVERGSTTTLRYELDLSQVPKDGKFNTFQPHLNIDYAWINKSASFTLGEITIK